MTFTQLLKEALNPADVQGIIKNINAQMDQLYRHVDEIQKENIAMKNEKEQAQKAQVEQQKKASAVQTKAQEVQQGSMQRGVGTTKTI